MNELKPLKLIKKENGYKIRQYVKTINLVKIDEPKKSLWEKFKYRLLYKLTNPCYHQLTTRQKQVLHTIAPLWGNIIENNLQGDMIITDDKGNRYDLDSINAQQCLVGEVYDFGTGYRKCVDCYHFNMNFASLNDIHSRNAGYLDTRKNLPEFLDHYYLKHLLPKIEAQQMNARESV